MVLKLEQVTQETIVVIEYMYMTFAEFPIVLSEGSSLTNCKMISINSYKYS